jgi:hypothetical protein
MSFITVDELKDYPLPVKNSMWDKINGVSPYQIQKVLDYATQNIKDYLDRDIELTEYVERIFVSKPEPKLILNQYPVTELTSISSTDLYGNIITYSLPSFFSGENGIIEWIDKTRNGFYPTYVYTVSYTAGYATIPGPIKHATALQAISMLEPMFRGGTNFAQIDLVEGTEEIIVDMLEKYRRKRIG